MVDALVYVFNHLDNHVSGVIRTLEVIFKNCFVSSLPHVPTRYHKNCFPLPILNTMWLMIDVLEDPFTAIRRRKKVSNLI